MSGVLVTVLMAVVTSILRYLVTNTSAQREGVRVQYDEALRHAQLAYAYLRGEHSTPVADELRVRPDAPPITLPGEPPHT